jgi:hypothetical protein
MADVLRALGVELHGTGTQQIKCPVHEDRKPSARFYADDNRVFCFVCGRGWDALTVVIYKLKIDRDAARQWLKTRVGLVAVETGDKLRAVLRSRPSSLAQVEAQLDQLDLQIKAKAPDPWAACRFWQALDVLRHELKSKPLVEVEAKLKRLRGRIGV